MLMLVWCRIHGSSELNVVPMPICPASFDGVGRAWFRVEEIRERILERRGTLILPEIGEAAPAKTQGCCVLHKDFLGPIIMAMRAHSTLVIPSVQTIFDQVEELWQTHFLAKQKKKSAKGSGRYPSRDPYFQLDLETLTNAWTDAKGIKSLLVYVRKQFLSGRVSKESWLALSGS